MNVQATQPTSRFQGFFEAAQKVTDFIPAMDTIKKVGNTAYAAYGLYSGTTSLTNTKFEPTAGRLEIAEKVTNTASTVLGLIGSATTVAASFAPTAAQFAIPGANMIGLGLTGISFALQGARYFTETPAQ